MLMLKLVPVLLLALAAGAEKKIELQDIEEDNLKSEKQDDYERSEPRAPAGGPGAGPQINALDFLKSGLLRYFESPTQSPQQQRYVQQYAVTEPPERPAAVQPKSHYGGGGGGGPGPATQQAMVGYLSNVPMQIYLVPQYYNEQAEPAAAQPAVQYVAHAPPRAHAHAHGYPTAPDAVQHNNYVEVPTYVTPTGKAYLPQYTHPVAYVTYAHPTLAPAPAPVTPVVYQMPVVQYPTAVAAPPVGHKGYYHSPPQYTETNTVDDAQEEEENVHKHHYAAQTEAPYTKSPAPEYPRYYNSRTPIREEYRPGPASELPPPSPLLLRGPPPHLAHLPKALPVYRPLTKPVYAAGGSLISHAYAPRPSTEAYGLPFKRRPTSLLDSYIPSGLQIEYLKRGLTKDPLAVYEALSTGRHLSPSPARPRQYERGFLPNQMYHTAAGGITYGHYKRSPKGEKLPQK